MENPFKTPSKGLSKNDENRRVSGAHSKAVDLVTGKAKVEYFFDPSLVLEAAPTETPFKGTPFKKDLSSSLAAEATGDPLLYGSKHLYMPCAIVKKLEDDGSSNKEDPSAVPMLVKTSDGTLHKIRDSTKLIPLTAPDDYVGMRDVLHLAHVTEASLLHTLRLRYKRDDIYTSAGPILISINPYKTVTTGNGESLYSDNKMLLYRDRDLGKSMEHKDQHLAPHLFEVADRAYSALIESVEPADTMHMEEEDAVLALEKQNGKSIIQNQSIIISGESGAGKTEATKIIMQYLARITKKSHHLSPIKSPEGKVVAALEDRVLSSNPLLESFGNARTLRNDNSSRFGKFIRLSFSTKTGHIVGATISNYLLEKTRITTQVDGERNYHIFYQLLTGAKKKRLEELGLAGGVSDFRYLANREAQKSKRDATGFTETKECLSNIGLASEEQKHLFEILAAVLHIGNIEFEADGAESEKAKIKESTMPSLEKACNLLGLNKDAVAEAMLSKLLSVGGKTIHTPQNVVQATDKRDSLAKLTYSSLFVWLVKRVNKTISAGSHGLNGSGDESESEDDPVDLESGNNGFIGVLDIYGFESFEVNGYEQFLINYCNEKLQRHFNRHLFEVEQELYSSEGVDWSYISFNDNRPCLELIEGGGGSAGVLGTLDDAWGGMGTGSEKDVNFVSHLHNLYGGMPTASVTIRSKKGGNQGGSHPHFVMPKFGSDRQFIVVHYAGEVRYTANGFVEKNMDSLSNELKDLGDASNSQLAKEIFACTTSSQASNSSGVSGRRSTIRGVSVGSQFKSSLQKLVADLEQTQPHYIRCIKPNLNKQANSLDSGEVLRQLRYAGMMETIRIRREGYALRENHGSFYNRFRMLLNPDEFKGATGIEHLVQVLSKRLTVTEHDWQIGHTKIFLRRELADKLERFAKLKVHAAARTVGRFGRFVAQRRAATVLSVWARFRLHMLKKYRESRAATRIISMYRMHYQVRIYAMILTAVIKLQSFQRRKLATERVRIIRDPYSDMSFKELQKLLQDEQLRLESAVNGKDFQAAAEIENKLEPLKEAVESKRPLTRSVLESRIEELQKQIDDALSRKAYTECAPLNDKMEAMVKMRTNYPTIDELRSAVREAESTVAAAAEQRDFSAAASGQAKIDEARKNLQEALEAEGICEDEVPDEPKVEEVEEKSETNNGFDSRADLEKEIASLSEQIQNAIDSKDFQTASSLQPALDNAESLRGLFPTVEEMQEKLTKTKAAMDDAIAKKDFSGAHELNDEIESLEKKIEAEKSKEPAISEPTESDKSKPTATVDGESKTFESRADLEQEIVKTTESQEDAVKSKQFKKAESLQKLLHDLEDLRKLLPSMSELEAQLKEQKKAMEAAIAEKRFSDAEEIDSRISQIDKKLELERSKAPKKSLPIDKENIPTQRKINRSAPVIATIEPQKTIATIPKVITAQSSKKPALSSDSTNDRPVSKLRPKKPLVSRVDDSILSVTQMLAKKRGAASLVIGGTGLAGIITDTDITRRVVAKDVDPSCSVSKVMTPNPTCVSMSDPAMEALATMVENHFRHLPVVDSKGSVVGLLDIAKCLNDAISKLERSQEKDNSAAEDAVKQVANLQGAGGAQAAALQALLGPLMSQAFGGQQSPTLRSILAGKPATMVSPDTSLRDAGEIMADRRKAALVVDDGELVGIFGFKDMMTRAIAKELPLSETAISSVMTPEPESVSPDMTVLEALQTMHDHKFLTLPVCESDGTVVGIVDVMDCIYNSSKDGWRSLFDSAMEIDDGTASLNSGGSGASAGRSVGGRSSVSARGSVKSAKSTKDERPVSKLRPKKPLISTVDDSILSVTQMLAKKRGDASLVIGSSGGLAGIITDTDITRRVVAKDVDPHYSIAKVMTPNPTCVSMSDPAMEALATMVENHFRHLPVVDSKGSVVGLLDIAKCLNDAISKLERSNDQSNSAAEDAVKQVANLQGAGGAQAAALQALLGPLMSQAFGGQQSPTLRSILVGKPATMVSPDTSLRDAGEIMADRRKAALVVDDGELVGIFGFKDMMTRAIAKELPLSETAISSVMTPEPESVSPDMTVLEALQTMHDHKFLTLPVCESDGTVVGIVDVMDCIYNSSKDGWRSLFDSAMEIDDGTASLNSGGSGASVGRSVGGRSSVSARGSVKSAKSTKDERPVSKLRPKKPLVSRVDDSILSVTQMLAKKRGDASLVIGSSGGLAGIITDTDITRRVVAKDVDPHYSIAKVMTPNPTCVSMSDPAMEALATMVENHFRHLPVVDSKGSVVGLLDIAKCLNDAISKLERSQEKDNSAAEDAVKQVANLQGAGGAQAAALQALLGPLMSQAFGGQQSPTLRSILAGKPATMVSPDTSLRDAGEIMADRRKAALVVDDGELVGIFGFKDMMTRAIAKELPLSETAISSVMTPEPESVSPDMTVLEALQTMHDHKFLTLPVCESDGTVVGIVDVMDCIYNSSKDGWRSLFDSAMEIDDGTASLNSGGSGASAGRSVGGRSSVSARGSVKSAKSTKDERPVSKLRPKKPLISTVDDSILSVTQMLAKKRGDASLVIGSSGGLAGIITDTDITRRVVAKDVDPHYSIAKVMTPNPTCVSMSDPAMEALATMVENHFRHLPVVDSKGSVVGLLDIAKCLNDAISKLERSNDQSNSAAEDAVKQVANLQGAGGAQAAALQALLGPLMSQAFGGQQSPTLRSILAGKPATMVSPDTSLRDAGEIMADRRKAALVVDDGELVGIFGFKDMMTRAIAKELPLSETAISSVMTPEPESVSPDMTVLEALQTMHDHKFLTLPVCESDGTVVGIVDVMDCIYNSSKDGWRSLFDSAMEIDDGTASIHSGASVGRSVGGRSSVSARGSVKSAKSTKDERPVSKLRPKKPLLSSVDDTVLAVTQKLARKRGDASLVIGSSGGLAGIITDTDITRRVVAKDVDPSCIIAKVMTPNPTCVSMSDPAMEALATMVENHFRHLPVVDSKGSVVGLLDIAKCLNDAISKLERSNDQSNSAAEDAVKQVANLQGAGGAQAAALQALLGPLMSQAFGGQQSPTLRSILAGKPATMVSPDTSLRDAGEIMADRRKAALVVDDGELVGIFGFKDMMTRAIAKELPLSETAISSVMTPEPESVSPDMTVLEALQTMHDHKFLTLPVCESDGTVVGIVDVMDCIYNSSKDGWRSLFDSAMEIEGGDDASQSIDSMTRPEDDIGPLRSEEVKIMVSPETRFASVPRGIPTELLVEDSGDNDSLGVSLLNEPTRDFGGGASQADLTGSVSTEGQILFKVVDPNGKTHRIRSDLKLDKLLNQLLKKIKGVEDSSSIILNFSDDEGDEILITNDDDLIESVNVARSTGNKVVKLTATLQESKQLDQNVVIAGAAGAVLAIIVAVVLATTKGKK